MGYVKLNGARADDSFGKSKNHLRMKLKHQTDNPSFIFEKD